ncbi:hypothetical protein A0128_13335 [Leptospira tipperaryensis]|uniref:PF07600 family protein n=1 Tax=Leptospira tipperaryensis TaxID=2564040 RepID=A0A1D7V2L6_9LEPT|nr:hypothetical protein A0128_13335 [Leptospira tipperaryensis]
MRSLLKGKHVELGDHSKSKRISASDLWIPKRYVPHLRRQIAISGSLKNYLEFLLIKNRSKFPSMFDFSKNEKTTYQNLNLELVRFSFRPNSSDWAELRVVARYYGLSICNFFVMLIQIEGDGAQAVDRFVSKKTNTLKINGKKNGITLIQSIVPGRKFISFSILLGGTLPKTFSSDS